MKNKINIYKKIKRKLKKKNIYNKKIKIIYENKKKHYLK